MFCGENTLLKRGSDVTDYHTLRCRSWNCEACRPLRKNRCIAEAVNGNPKRFMTLTIRRTANGDPDAAARLMMLSFNILVKRIRRRHPAQRFEYYYAVEKTEHGWPHLHILFRGPWISQRWLSQQWNDLTDSPIVHVFMVRNRRKATYYASKYLGKNPHRFEGCRRYGRSGRYLPKAFADARPDKTLFDNYEILRTDLDDIEAALKQIGKDYDRRGDWLRWYHGGRSENAAAPP